MNEFQKSQNAKILSCYKTEEELEISKSEVLDLVKGGKKAFIGEKRTFAGREYIKTSDGWKFHGKGTGSKAQEHAARAVDTSSKTEEAKIRFNPDDKLMFTPKFGDKFEVNFRGYSNSNETKAVIAGKFGQMEVDITQLEKMKLRRETPKPTSSSGREKGRFHCSDVFSISEQPEESAMHNEAFDYMEENEISFSDQPVKSVEVNKLIPTQGMVEYDKVNSLRKEGKDNKNTKGIEIIKVDGKYYLDNGHHRVTAQILEGATEIKGHVFDYDIIKRN